MTMPVRLALLARVLCLIVVALMGSGVFVRGEAWGQAQPNYSEILDNGLTALSEATEKLKSLTSNASAESEGPSVQMTEAETRAIIGGTGATTGPAAGLTGSGASYEATRTEEDRYNTKKYLDTGANGFKGGSVSIRPMQGIQQIADSKVVKGMLKDLITSEVPVMYQTMMMVENGAATGFIGAMGSVGDILDSTMQASRLQLAMYDAFDDTGRDKKRYQEAIRVEMTKNHADSWPSALWAAAADKLDKQSVTPIPQQYNSAHEESGGPSANTNESNAKDEEPTQEAELAEELFTEPKDWEKLEAEQRARQNETLDEWKEEFKDRIGDITTTYTNREGWIEQTFTVKPGTRSLDKDANKAAEAAYKGMMKILRKYCNFKAGSSNYYTGMFQKKKPGDLLLELKEEREDASAPDMPLSINYIDALFNSTMGDDEFTEDGWFVPGTCSAVFDATKEMPDSGPNLESGITMKDCKENTCLIHQLIAAGARFVGRSRVYHEYLILLRTAMRMTTNNQQRELLNYLIEQNLDNLNLQSEIADNQERWISFTNQLSAIAQGRVGSTIFRPQSGNITSKGVDSVSK